MRCKFAGALLTSVLIWPSLSHSLGFQHCHFNPPLPPQDLGPQLAAADRFDRAAESYELYPYERCFRLGRSCFGEIDSKLDQQAAAGRLGGPAVWALSTEPPSTDCRHLVPTLDRETYESWLPQRKLFNACIANGLRIRAEAIREFVFNQSETASFSQFLLNIDNKYKSNPKFGLVFRTPLELTNAEISSVVSNVTWCPMGRASYQVGIFCPGGGVVIATSTGEEQRLEYSQSDESQLCISDLVSPPTCHKVTFKKGKFKLTPSHPQLNGEFIVNDGVDIGTWRTACSTTR